MFGRFQKWRTITVAIMPVANRRLLCTNEDFQQATRKRCCRNLSDSTLQWYFSSLMKENKLFFIFKECSQPSCTRSRVRMQAKASNYRRNQRCTKTPTVGSGHGNYWGEMVSRQLTLSAAFSIASHQMFGKPLHLGHIYPDIDVE